MADKGQRIQDLVGLVHQLYDPALAEEWDNVGLQVGDPNAQVDKVMVSLDPCLAAVQAARAAGAQALVTHHPLLLHPLKSLRPDHAFGKVLWNAVRSEVAIISAHTNLDVARDGLNDWLAGQLGLRKTEPLQPLGGHFLKLVVFVPADHQEQVADALFAAGAGQIGAYDQCSFRTRGEGTFRPGQETNPFIGESGQTERVEEVRLETIVAKHKLSRVVDKMFKAHPYEEVAYDLIALENQVPGAGLGRIGRLEERVTLDEFSTRIKSVLDCQQLRVVGCGQRNVQKVALCGGSGASLIRAAHRLGADLLLTGDVKYHDARQAEELGIAVIDAGHFATEKLVIERLAAVLQETAAKHRWEINVTTYTGEQDPFRFY